MPRPCSICARDDRAAIDVRCSAQVVNVRALAVELGVGREALRKHRDKHIPDFLVAFSARANAPTVGTLMAEYQRHYLAALDHLAQAEAGVISHVDKDGNAHKLVSNTAIRGALAEVRKSLAAITNLAADAATEDERPRGIDSSVLDKRMTDALSTVLSRALSSTPASGSALPVLDAVEVSDLPTDEEGVAGEVVVGPGPHAPTSIPLDAVMAPETLPGITPTARKALEDSTRSDGSRHEGQSMPVSIITVPNPNYPGSIEGSSSEERKAVGYPDVELTLDDLKAADPKALAELIRRSMQ